MVLPKLIYIMRHLHKDEMDPKGGLSASGLSEAKYLHDVFCVLFPRDHKLPKPTHYFSQYPFDKLEPPLETSVNRVYETMEPISKMENKTLITDPTWDRHATLAVAQKIAETCLYTDVVLLAWQHNCIPQLAQKLGFTWMKTWGTSPTSGSKHNHSKHDYASVWVLCQSSSKPSKVLHYHIAFPHYLETRQQRLVAKNVLLLKKLEKEMAPKDKKAKEKQEKKKEQDKKEKKENEYKKEKKEKPSKKKESKKIKNKEAQYRKLKQKKAQLFFKNLALKNKTLNVTVSRFKRYYKPEEKNKEKLKIKKNIIKN
jgi:hypothetical protein